MDITTNAYVDTELTYGTPARLQLPARPTGADANQPDETTYRVRRGESKASLMNGSVIAHASCP